MVCGYLGNLESSKPWLFQRRGGGFAVVGGANIGSVVALDLCK